MSYYAGKYDVAVIGAGHAGCEAANAASKMGFKTALISSNIKSLRASLFNKNLVDIRVESKI